MTTIALPRFEGSRYSISMGVACLPVPGPTRVTARRPAVRCAVPYRLVPGHQPRHLTAEQSGIVGIGDHRGDRVGVDGVRVDRGDAHDREADDVDVVGVAEPPVATSTQTWRRWVTGRGVESPFRPVARMTNRWRPGAIVPALIVSVESVPLPLVGVTAAGLKLVGADAGRQRAVEREVDVRAEGGPFRFEVDCEADGVADVGGGLERARRR